MKLSILCIGDELLRGVTVNTNQSYLGLALMEIGIIPEQVLTVKDDPGDLKRALDFLVPMSDVVITTGGLGPTVDDLTKQAIAAYFNRSLIEDATVIAKIENYYKMRGLTKRPSKRVLIQAQVPEQAEVLTNDVGTAPGIIIKQDQKMVIMLPGPPHEAMPMLLNSVIPILKKRMKQKIHTEIIYVAGLPESEVEEKVQPVVEQIVDLEVAYCAAPEKLKVFLTSQNSKTVVDATIAVKRALGPHVMIYGKTLAEDLVNLLIRNKKTVATAESCTGGLLSAAITDIPGVSTVYNGSIITYSNEWKHNYLGVENDILLQFGAVSEECARQMVSHLCKRYGTDAGMAVTGIAGPGGGTPEKPVGTVFIGVQYDDKVIVKKKVFPGNRETVRRRTVASAMNMLRELII